MTGYTCILLATLREHNEVDKPGNLTKIFLQELLSNL